MAHSLQPYCPLFESDLVAMSKFFRLISWGDFFVYFEVKNIFYWRVTLNDADTEEPLVSFLLLPVLEAGGRGS